MSDAVKRYWVDDPELHTLLLSDDGGTMHAFVLATAYDALEAENLQLKAALLVAQNFIHDYSGRKADAATRVISAALAASNNKGDGT